MASWPSNVSQSSVSPPTWLPRRSRHGLYWRAAVLACFILRCGPCFRFSVDYDLGRNYLGPSLQPDRHNTLAAIECRSEDFRAASATTGSRCRRPAALAAAFDRVRSTIVSGHAPVSPRSSVAAATIAPRQLWRSHALGGVAFFAVRHARAPARVSEAHEVGRNPLGSSPRADRCRTLSAAVG